MTDTIQNNKKFMQELIDKLIEKTGINPDQEQKALETIKDYVKEKFPMMAGAVDKLFEADDSSKEDYAD